MKKVKCVMLLLLVALCFESPELLIAAPPSVQSKGSPIVVCSALDGISVAFHSYPLVGIGDYHGFAQEEDFSCIAGP